MKTICIVAEYMFCGGSEKSLLAFLEYLDRSMYDITLLLMKKKGDLLLLLPNDLKVEEIVLPDDESEDLLAGRANAVRKAVEQKKYGQAISKVVRGLRMSMAAKTAAAKRIWYYESIGEKIAKYPRKFDIVIDYMGYGLFNTFYAAKKVDGKVKISWVHFEPEIAMPDFVAFRKVLAQFDHIMCVSGNSMEQVKRMMPELSDKCHIFYNIVNEKSIRRQAEEEYVEKPEGKKIILSVGRLDPPKGFDIAIRSIARLYREGYPIVFQIIGEGWQRGALEKQISEDEAAAQCVQLIGQKINPYPYFAACDIYVQPSRHEGYGIAVAEARALNKPILVTNFAGAHEQLKKDVTGVIVECDEESLYNGLKRMLDDQKLLDTLSENLAKEHEDIPPQMMFFNEIATGT